MDDLDLVLEELAELSVKIRELAGRLAEYVREHGDDPVAYALADLIFVALREERRFRRLLAVGIAG